MDQESTAHVVLSFGTNLYQSTNVQPIALTALIVMCTIILFSKRNYVFVSIIILMILIPSAQRIIVAGVDFTFLRISIIMVAFRIVVKNEMTVFRINFLDRLVILWTISTIITFTLLHQSFSALINRLGYITDTTVVYFVFRCLIRGEKDIEYMFKWFMIFSIPVFVFFIIERTFGYNIFSVFGGVPSHTVIREGRLRVQGAFSHPILAGCFWASLFPYYFNKYNQNNYERFKMSFVIMIILFMIYLTASSTPFIGLVSGIVAVLMFKYRKIVRFLPYYMIAVYILLDIAMKAPVWHLISRVDIAGGSTGWHRYWLINQAITNFNEWAFLGTKNIYSWNVFANDITNQYIKIGVTGGALTLALFIWVLIEAIRIVLKGTDQKVDRVNNGDKYILWSLGAVLFVHIVNFVGVFYFGQIVMLVYINLAMIGSLYQKEKRKQYTEVTDIYSLG